MFKDCICFHRGADITAFDLFLSRLKQSIKNSGSNDVASHLKGLEDRLALDKAMVTGSSEHSPQRSDEDIIIECLEEKEMLLVFDGMDDFLQIGGACTASFNKFLSRIFENAKNVKVLVVCNNNIMFEVFFFIYLI